MRQRISFDENWRFTRDDKAGSEQSSFDDSDWIVVNLPHDWSIAGPFSQDHPSGGGGGYLPGGIGWYRKTFEWALATQKKTIHIEFDGVYKNSHVWLTTILLVSTLTAILALLTI
jgi:beta-galactosidase